MKKSLLVFVCNKLAAFYWVYLKPAIDNYVLNTQKDKFSYFGKQVVFKGGGTIFHPENISIGNYVQIGENYFIMGIGGVEIGDGTIISRNVCIHSGNHDFKNSDMIPYDTSYLIKKIIIGKGVWIGQNVNILPGVTIGDGAIIGMGTTVSKNVSSYAIVVGTGQREIGLRNKEKFEKALKEENYFGTIYS